MGKMSHREAALRMFTEEAGLADDSKFLSHWFGLKRIGDESASSAKLPRPSPWNMFTQDVEPIHVEEKKCSFGLRAFAADLPEDSKFLSHWFGLTNSAATMDDKLPRPSAWNYFANDDESEDEDDEPAKNGFTLHAWAFDAGLPEDSQFLSHWFGLSQSASTAYTDRMGPARTATPWVRA